MKLLVQKFGGTSVSTPERRQQAAQKILQAVKDGYSPVVVVSAPGRIGEPYATDTLIQTAKQECPAIEKRELDMIMSCGEIIAGVIVTGTLKNSGLDAVLLTGQQAGIITTCRHGNAQILHIRPDAILKHAAEGKVVVVAGFQGISEDGDITTLGRGGSDTTAAAIGAAIQAAAVDIYTDVNGMMTADPRIVSDARTIPAISYEAAYQMAVQGAKVIHPRAVEISMRYNIPLNVKCTFSEEAGTAISNDSAGMIERPKNFATIGIAQQKGYGVLKLHNGDGFNHANTQAVFKELAATGGDKDFMGVTENDIEIVAEEPVIEAIGEICSTEGIEIQEKRTGCVKISLIGRYASDDAGLFSTFVEMFYRHNIKVLCTFTGTSSISGLVETEAMEAAVQAIHQDLF
ncbi:MAG: aspartate kinase [Veillonellales bacterium]